ncbi:MAG: diaminopimelate epimerase [Pseudobdellovibrionaceae bacterium]
MKLTKMSGAGNTFVMINALSDSEWMQSSWLQKTSRSIWAEVLCHPIWGLSADGCVFFTHKNSPNSFVWDFYNADGSSAEMCGNATRCAGQYVQKKLGSSDLSEFEFITQSGSVITEIQNASSVKVLMPKAKSIEREKILKVGGDSYKGYFVNTGVPHFVLQIQPSDDPNQWKSFLPQLRHHPDLKPRGTNVTLYSVQKSDYISAVSYERGVEDFTLACGTGAVAAAIAHSEKNLQKNSTTHVRMPGGVLQIDLEKDLEKIYMSGPADVVAEVDYNLDFVRTNEVVIEKFKINLDGTDHSV